MVELYCDIDGSFPNHHPDPTQPENLQDLAESVRLMDADLGLALDGDELRIVVEQQGGHGGGSSHVDPMAGFLAKAGHATTVYNRTSSKAERIPPPWSWGAGSPGPAEYAHVAVLVPSNPTLNETVSRSKSRPPVYGNLNPTSLIHCRWN